MRGARSATSASVSVSEVAASAGPQLAVDGAGDAAVIWERYSSGGPIQPNGTTSAVVATIRHGATGSWEPPVDIGTEHDGRENPFFTPRPRVALDAHGDATALWQGSDNAGATIVQSAVRLAASSAWQPPVSVSEPVAGDVLPDLAVDSAGHAVAVWQGSDGTHNTTMAARRPFASGAWQLPVTVSAAGANNIAPRVAVDPAGDAVAIWSRQTQTGFPLQASTLVAGADDWQPPFTIGSTGGYPEVALDQLGNAVAVWQHPLQSAIVIQAASYDRVPPLQRPRLAPPRLSDVRFSPSRFRVGRAIRRLQRGTHLRFTLSSPATVTVTIRRASRGNRSGAVGTLVRKHEPAGRDVLPFSGRIASRALPPGRYAATVLATSSSGDSAPATTYFRIER